MLSHSKCCVLPWNCIYILDTVHQLFEESFQAIAFASLATNVACGSWGCHIQWQKFTFSGFWGGAKSCKFPTILAAKQPTLVMIQNW